jgi:hypothetical protein
VAVGEVVWAASAQKRLVILPAQLVVGDSLDQQWDEVPDGAALEVHVRLTDHFGHPLGRQIGEGTHQSLPHLLDLGLFADLDHASRLPDPANR